MWPFKKKVQEDAPEALQRVCDLNIHFVNGGRMSWTCREITDAEHPWQEFLDWFHDRPESATHCIKADDGALDGLTRSDIRRYSVRFRLEVV